MLQELSAVVQLSLREVAYNIVSMSPLFLHFVVTVLHGMQTRSSDENAVCPSVCPSVCLSNEWIVTKQKKNLSRFLYHTKEHLAWFPENNNGW